MRLKNWNIIMPDGTPSAIKKEKIDNMKKFLQGTNQEWPVLTIGGEYKLNGEIYGHSTIPDGVEVSTPPVMTCCHSYRNDEDFIVVTKEAEIYTVSKEDFVDNA